MHRSKRRSAVLATLSVFTLVSVAACGDDDDDTTDGTEAVSGTDAEATTPSDTEAPAPSDTAPSDGTEAPSEEGDEGDGEIPSSPGETHVGDEGEPVQGGDLVYGLEADSANPWAPYRTSCATACYVMITSVSDPLFYATTEGDIAPMLVESYEANADNTEWTFTIREGITFHDGTPLDGAAVKFNIDSCRFSPLTGAAFTWITDVTASGQDVTISTPGNVAAPRSFTERQCGYMFSPTWLGTLADIPQRTEGTPIYDAELAATPADGNPAEPVGVGAFVFESYTPGNGNSFRLVRNEDYWRGPNGITGEELPYLDSIEGVVAVDIDSRSNGLLSGEFDVIHSASSDAITQFLDDDSVETTASSRFGDTSYLMINVAEGDADPEGANADSPMLNVHCRRALAFATDQERVIEERENGLTLPATGPFGPGMIGYLEDSGYPTFDPDQANAEMDTCLSDLGTDSIEFTFNTTNDPFNVETNTLILSIWQEVLGADRVQSSITPIEQGQYIGLALTGAFNVFGWRNHGGIDPDTQNYWWNSASSAPIGALALNFGRFKDPEMDAQFEIIRTNPDEAARKKATEEVNRIFGEQVYNIWTWQTLWGVVSQPYVNGVERNVLPDGGDGVGLAFSGRHMMNQIWCDEGSCD